MRPWEISANFRRNDRVSTMKEDDLLNFNHISKYGNRRARNNIVFVFYLHLINKLTFINHSVYWFFNLSYHTTGARKTQSDPILVQIKPSVSNSNISFFWLLCSLTPTSSSPYCCCCGCCRLLCIKFALPNAFKPRTPPIIFGAMVTQTQSTSFFAW